jgi:hypothetical protein
MEISLELIDFLSRMQQNDNLVRLQGELNGRVQVLTFERDYVSRVVNETRADLDVSNGRLAQENS